MPRKSKVKEIKEPDIYEKFENTHIYDIPEEFRNKIRVKRLMLLQQSDEVTDKSSEKDMHNFLTYGPDFKNVRQNNAIDTINKVCKEFKDLFKQNNFSKEEVIDILNDYKYNFSKEELIVIINDYKK